MAQISRIYQTLSRHKWSIFLLWSLWLSLEYLGLGPFSYVRILDTGDSALPWRLGLIREFFDNGFGLWSNIAASGFDRLAATELLFRVDSLFFLALPGWFAYGVVTFLQRFLAGYFTYRMCKDYLKLNELPSLVAGLAYSITFFDFQRQFAGEPGFPFILWSLEYISERRNVRGYILAFLLGIFALFSSSFPLSIPFILPLALVWFVLVRRKYSWRFLSLFATFSLVILVGKIPIIWALLVNASLSHRADWDYSDILGGNLWIGWITLVFGFMKSYVIYLIIGILGLYWSRFKQRSLLMVMVLLVFCGIVAQLWGPLYSYFVQYMGFFSGFRADRFYLLAPFFAVVAAAYGLHLLHPTWVLTQNGSHTKYRAQSILCIIVIIFVVLSSFIMKYDHLVEWVEGSSYAVNYENPDLQHLAADTDPSPFRVATIAYAYSLHPAYANAYGLESVDGYVALYPQRYQDFWGKVIEPLISKDEENYHYFHDFGSRIYLVSPSDGSFNNLEKVPFSDYYKLNLLSLANTKYLISEIPLSNEYLTLLPSQLPSQPTYVEIRKGDLSLNKVLRYVKRNFKGRHLYIYQNEAYLPRFFLSGKVVIFENSEQLLEAMAKADINTLRNSVFIEEKFASKINPERLGVSDGELTVEQYATDQVILSVDLDKPGILVVTNNYSPYWIGKVNGVKRDIFPAYHTFMGIFLEAGENQVELEYAPPYWSFD